MVLGWQLPQKLTHDNRFGNHNIYAIVSDGDLMEGLSSEAHLLQGH